MHGGGNCSLTAPDLGPTPKDWAIAKNLPWRQQRSPSLNPGLTAMRFPVAAALFLLLSPGIRAQDHTLPPDPNVTPLPPVTGKGVQIYHCDWPQGTPAWVFVAPEATLYAGTETVGTHGAGPTWRWKDGSAITGKLLISQPSPDGASIPWLLLA